MTQEKRHRNVAHLWADKRVLRFFRKHPTLNPLHRKQRGGLRSVYMALCEIDSDFGEGAIIRGFAKTVATYSGLGEDTVGPYLRALRDAELVDYHQTREEGQFGQTGLTLFKWEAESEVEVAEDILTSLTRRSRRKPLPVKAVTGETGVYKNPKGGNSKNPKENKNTLASSSRKDPSAKHEQLARLLQTAIEQRKKINKTVNLHSWPRQIRLLCSSLNGDKREARVRRAIIFLDRSYAEYGMQSEQQFIPTIESVRGFRDKFGKVENAMAREGQSGQRIITRRGGETVLVGGEPGLDKKWFPVDDSGPVRVWENSNGDRVACDTYPQPDPDGPVIGDSVD